MPILTPRWRAALLLMGKIVFYALSPVICVLLAAGIAGLLGCQMAGGDPAPCNCLGVDVGKPIYMMAMMGWFAIGTLPLGVIGVVAVLAITTVQEIVERLRDRSARQRAELEDF